MSTFPKLTFPEKLFFLKSTLFSKTQLMSDMGKGIEVFFKSTGPIPSCCLLVFIPERNTEKRIYNLSSTVI